MLPVTPELTQAICGDGEVDGGNKETQHNFCPDRPALVIDGCTVLLCICSTTKTPTNNEKYRS